jgi:hypothetical protein
MLAIRSIDQVYYDAVKWSLILASDDAVTRRMGISKTTYVSKRRAGMDMVYLMLKSGMGR